MHILVSYFDPFSGKPKNNSEDIAKLIAKNFDSSEHKITLCELRTVFDKAHEELMDCINAQVEPVDFVVSLGEHGCNNIKLETRGINFDKSKGPDNDGVDRHGTPIDPNGPKALGVTLPVDKAFCALSEQNRKQVYISHSAGSFVCNNTLYLGLQNFDVPYTFIHVPQASCTSADKNQNMSETISIMLTQMTKENLSDVILPSNKSEVKAKLSENLSPCEKMFYSILKKEY